MDLSLSKLSCIDLKYDFPKIYRTISKEYIYLIQLLFHYYLNRHILHGLSKNVFLKNELFLDVSSNFSCTNASEAASIFFGYLPDIYNLQSLEISNNSLYII